MNLRSYWSSPRPYTHFIALRKRTEDLVTNITTSIILDCLLLPLLLLPLYYFFITFSTIKTRTDDLFYPLTLVSLSDSLSIDAVPKSIAHGGSDWSEENRHSQAVSSASRRLSRLLCRVSMV